MGKFGYHATKLVYQKISHAAKRWFLLQWDKLHHLVEILLFIFYVKNVYLNQIIIINKKNKIKLLNYNSL